MKRRKIMLCVEAFVEVNQKKMNAYSTNHVILQNIFNENDI